jgi:hypothetical protein
MEWNLAELLNSTESGIIEPSIKEVIWRTIPKNVEKMARP